jgi:predicted enzyme related to lactoylglutathione lyase
MVRRNAGLWAPLFLLVTMAARGEPQEDPRNAHGKFTGEIKAVLYVTDVEKSAPFYRDVLGFGFEGFANSEGQPYYAEMSAAGVKFGLHEPVSKEQETKVGQERLYFRVEDLAAHRARVLAWGGDPGKIQVTSWMDMFTVRDPDGNEIVFAVTDPARHTSNPWRTSAPAEPTGDPQ